MKVLQRVLIAVVVLVVSVPVVAVLGFSLWWHHVTTGPDVRKESQSAKARQQRTATVAILDETVTAFVSTAPSGTRLATSVNDSCGSDTGFLGERPQMFCRRDVVVYLAFDGDQAGIQRTWTSGLAAHHWKRSERPPTGVQQYFYEFADSRTAAVGHAPEGAGASADRFHRRDHGGAAAGRRGRGLSGRICPSPLCRRVGGGVAVLPGSAESTAEPGSGTRVAGPRLFQRARLPGRLNLT
jgi:hypothetical protein